MTAEGREKERETQQGAVVDEILACSLVDCCSLGAFGAGTFKIALFKGRRKPETSNKQQAASQFPVQIFIFVLRLRLPDFARHGIDLSSHLLVYNFYN